MSIDRGWLQKQAACVIQGLVGYCAILICAITNYECLLYVFNTLTDFSSKRFSIIVLLFRSSLILYYEESNSKKAVFLWKLKDYQLCASVLISLGTSEAHATHVSTFSGLLVLMIVCLSNL